ncbi:hypothetical protein ACUOFC_13065, partial [Escherichia sp. TWPC-MK]
MNRFSKTQIYLHWITLLFVAITYDALMSMVHISLSGDRLI